MARTVCSECGVALTARELSVSGVCNACGATVAEVTGFLSFDEAPPVELVAFDVETTGLYPDSAGITEIGAVRFRTDGTILDTFVSLANPGYRISPEIARLTGISDGMIVAERPTVQVLRDWVAWLGPAPILVAHNASFDMQFIHAALTESEFRVIDTLEWARECALPVANHKLATLLGHIGYKSTHFHRAEADARGVVALCCYLVSREVSGPKAVTLEECLGRHCVGSRELCNRKRAARPAVERIRKG